LDNFPRDLFSNMDKLHLIFDFRKGKFTEYTITYYYWIFKIVEVGHREWVSLGKIFVHKLQKMDTLKC